MKKITCYVTTMAAAFAVLCMPVAHASDNSVTALPAEGNVQCSDYAANKVVMSMDSSSPQSSGTVDGPANVYDADPGSANETASYGIEAGNALWFNSSTPVDFAVLKNSRTVEVFMYASGGTNNDANLALPGGLEITAFSLCYGLNNAPVNEAPVLAPIGSQEAKLNGDLSFGVSASDDGLPAGSVLSLAASSLPAGASFVDNGDGTGSFVWSNILLGGSYDVTFTASDGELSDSETITITVTEPLVVKNCAIDGTLDQTGVVCPTDGSRALVCNMQLDESFLGLQDNSSCCICNEGGTGTLEQCDPDLPEGSAPVNGLGPCVNPADVKNPLEVTTHIEFNNDPYYCYTSGGRRICYRY